MSERDEHEGGTKAADTRPSGLAAALLRTGASLDLETVLDEVVESARALGGTRYGAIATIDETGIDRVFAGHDARELVEQRGNTWCIDTGAGFPAMIRLTLARIDVDPPEIETFDVAESAGAV